MPRHIAIVELREHGRPNLAQNVASIQPQRTYKSLDPLKELGNRPLELPRRIAKTLDPVIFTHRFAQGLFSQP